LEQVLAHQYASGFAPRAWVSGQLVEQDYADSPVWIAPAVHAMAAENGQGQGGGGIGDARARLILSEQRPSAGFARQG